MNRSELISYVAVLLAVGIFIAVCFLPVWSFPLFEISSVLAGLMLLVLVFLAIRRVAQSEISDVARPLWVAVAILFPLLGAVSVFVVLKNKKS